MSRRKIDPARACLHVEKWPAPDRALWADAVCGDDFENEAQVRPKWRPTTVQANREGYGRWINHLVNTGADLNLPPAERVTSTQVKLYLKELRGQELAPQTRSNRISQLLSVMLVFAPERDWDWLRRMFNRLEAIANSERKQKPLTVLSGDILGRAMKALNTARARDALPDYQSAIDFRNGLMIAVLTLTPLRRDNFANLTLGTNLKFINDEWMADIPAKRTKQKKPDTKPIPKVLNPAIQFYLNCVRPILLAGKATDRLWIRNRHTPMTSHSIYVAVADFTRKEFGEAIGPHRFRHIAATSTVIGAPEQIEEARALLSHSDTRMTHDHYIIAKSLAVSRKQAQLIADLRAALPSCQGGLHERRR